MQRPILPLLAVLTSTCLWVDSNLAAAFAANHELGATTSPKPNCLDLQALASPAYAMPMARLVLNPRPFLHRLNGLGMSLIFRLQGHPLVANSFKPGQVSIGYAREPLGAFWKE